MRTRNPFTTVARAALAAACLFSASGCGGELLRTGRAPVYLVVTRVIAAAGGGSGAGDSSFLLSDVQTLVDTTINGQTVKVPTVFNDNVTIDVRIEAKNPQFPTTAINSVTMTRYRVVFRRTDGRNAPGTDVPYPFDGALTATISESASLSFEIVRHQAKLEPPLKNLAGFGGLGFISTIAEITLWGRDQNGNEVVANANLEVHFGDFGDES